MLFGGKKRFHFLKSLLYKNGKCGDSRLSCYKIQQLDFKHRKETLWMLFKRCQQELHQFSLSFNGLGWWICRGKNIWNHYLTIWWWTNKRKAFSRTNSYRNNFFQNLGTHSLQLLCLTLSILMLKSEMKQKIQWLTSFGSASHYLCCLQNETQLEIGYHNSQRRIKTLIETWQ